ncbi:unnamed protein product [Oncorhynchus mykiss]|uniref:Uncharacterized protein n=1 Tax=Oncorhynchus mykiss TaxID=8022 RepID=A0A060WT71_ONCMY|nr:unnamed protein product [Oncorhynchus mykiss]
MEGIWSYILANCAIEVLKYILQRRGIQPNRSISSPEQPNKSTQTREELRELLCEALSGVICASYWLPPLLQAGLEPSLLLHHTSNMLAKADSHVLNYLEFVNWLTPSRPHKNVLEQQMKQKYWRPHVHLGKS